MAGLPRCENAPNVLYSVVLDRATAPFATQRRNNHSSLPSDVMLRKQKGSGSHMAAAK